MGEEGIMSCYRLFTSHLLVAAACLVSISAFADSADAVATDAMAQMDRMVDIILTVKDKPSAEKAVADLKPVLEDLKKIGGRAKAVGTPSPEVKAQIAAKMQAKAVQFQKRIADAKEQFAKAGVEATAILAKGMMELGKTMQEAMQGFEQADKAGQK
jgi:hypothetical protein